MIDLRDALKNGKAKQLAAAWWLVKGIDGSATIVVRMTDDPDSPQVAVLEIDMAQMLDIANFVLGG